VRTFSPKVPEIQRAWYVVDAEGQILGRLASQVAHILRGKHRPYFAPHVDTGDHVIVINADKIVLTSVVCARPPTPNCWRSRPTS
jgi:large subunit ribosomal protein L13